MSIQTIGVGAADNDGTGDTARAAFDKVNDNFAELYNIYGSEVETQTFTTKQDDLAINDYTRILRWDGAGSTGISGLALAAGRVATIVNASTDYLLWLENQNTASAATNRFMLPDGFPAFLMPGDSITVWKDGTTDRVRVLDWPTRGARMGLSEFNDSSSLFSPYAGGAGTGAGGFGASSAGVDTTRRADGVWALTTGTTSTGSAYNGWTSATSVVVPTLGARLMCTRLSIIDAVTDGTETYKVQSGWIEPPSVTQNDGVFFEYRWNGSAPECSLVSAAGGALTRITSGAPSALVLNDFVWAVLFVNPGWTRTDLIWSADSVSFALRCSVSSGLPSSSQLTGPIFAAIAKSAGSTARRLVVDLVGQRVHQVRGT